METQEPKMLNLDEVREKLSGARGPEYWRSLEQVAETPEFEAWLEDEFPNRRSIADIDRRSLLKLMGASMMLAGLGGCRSLFLPTEKVIPYVKMPEDLLPGVPMQYATAMAWNGTAIGLVVESHEGRPTKIEGNPLHPASLGRSDHFAQAAILNLYDPDRLSGATNQGDDSSWELFLRGAREVLDEQKATGGDGIVFLTEPTTSPTLIRQIDRFQKVFPKSRWIQYSPVNDDNVRAGLEMATGFEFTPLYALDKADVILSLDGDFLFSMPNSVRMARDYATRREVWNADVSELNRLYVVESTVTITGGMADHRLAVKPTSVEAFARAVAARLGIAVMDVPNDSTIPAKWLDVVVSDLQSAGNKALVIAGPQSSPAVHALVAAINTSLGAIGTTVTYQAPLSLAKGNTAEAVQQLWKEGNDGKVKALFVLGGNPVFSAPSDAPIKGAMKSIPFSVALSTHANETTELAKWRLAESHFLETWGDVRGYDGTATIQQPLIQPLRDTKSAIELIDLLLSGSGSGYDLVKGTWQPMATGDFERTWADWLNQGVVDLPALKNLAQAPIKTDINFGPAPAAKGTAFTLLPDPSIWDGCMANNAWMQELPRVMTTLTWDNAALIGPKMAQDLGVRDGDHVRISAGSREITIPALLTVGMPDDTVTLHFGNGREVVGNVGQGAGTNVFPLRTTDSPNIAYGTIAKVNGHTTMALTQTHHSMEGRDIVKVATVDAFAKDTKLTVKGDEEAAEGMNMYPSNEQEYPFDGAQWGMAIDLNTCIGCHACVTACQSENNIPVVGKDQVTKGREMHWIRIDRYYRTAGLKESDTGVMSKNVPMDNSRDIIDPEKSKEDVLDPNRIETVFAPVTCMHCEKAPCEPVCPVAATVHSHEGLNQMVYNRCVGTRYCSNNCPYKVRRFNFLNYTDNQAQFMKRTETFNAVFSSEKEAGNGREMLRMLSNPNVTVRGRGVMEKCTYCVQRLNHTRIDAKKENRAIKDGEVLTACQQACPTNAIIFGNIADPNSRVRRVKADPRSYSMLPELNTVNRTTYLARLRNPHKDLETA